MQKSWKSQYYYDFKKECEKQSGMITNLLGGNLWNRKHIKKQTEKSYLVTGNKESLLFSLK